MMEVDSQMRSKHLRKDKPFKYSYSCYSATAHGSASASVTLPATLTEIFKHLILPVHFTHTLCTTLLISFVIVFPVYLVHSLHFLLIFIYLFYTPLFIHLFIIHTPVDFIICIYIPVHFIHYILPIHLSLLLCTSTHPH